ncbi:unnamed protein product, partial [Leuciscus chuanchicus]
MQRCVWPKHWNTPNPGNILGTIPLTEEKETSWSGFLKKPRCASGMTESVFVCSQHTEGVTDQQVTLGQSVTLACEFKCKAAIWFVIKPSVRPVMILRTSESEKPDYYDEKFRNKYTEGSRSQLIINTVTVDDLGTYYCIKPGRALQVSDGMRLDTTEGPDEPKQKNPPQRAYQTLIVVFTLLMLVLFAAVI